MKRGDVLQDFNRHCAIVVDQGRVLTKAVELECGELVIRALRPEQLLERGFKVIDYPLRRAVRIFLQHSGGVSLKARAALKEVASCR